MQRLFYLGIIVYIFTVLSCQNNQNLNIDVILPSNLVEAQGGKYYGDTLKVNSAEIYTSLFPSAVTDIYSQHISSQIYEGLLKFNPENLSIEPCIAESFHIDSLNSEYTFKIRENVFFHDDPCFNNNSGRSVTAQDIKFVFEFLCSKHDLNTSPILWRNYIQGAEQFYAKKADNVSGIIVKDDHTITIKLIEPFSGFLNILALTQTAIFPKEALDYYGSELHVKKAVGTGPFTLKSADEHILLEKNSKYWQTDEFGNQLPLLSYVEIKFLNDKSKELAEFLHGNIDFIWGLPVEEIQNVIGSFEDAIEGKNKEFTLQSINNLQVEYYAFSFKDSLIKDIHFRKALNYAIDKAFIASNILEGSVLPAMHGIIPEINGYDKSLLNGYHFDPKMAKKELAKSSYKSAKNDKQLTLYYNNSGQMNKPIAQEIKKQLKANLNLDLNLEESDRKSFFDKLNQGDLPFWRYGWIADYPDPANFMASFHSKNIQGSSNNSNIAQFRNQAFDQYFNAAMAEVNIEKRMTLLATAEQILLDEAAIIPLFYYTSIRLVNPKLTDFPINELEFRDYSKAYFSGAKKKTVRVYDNIENAE